MRIWEYLGKENVNLGIISANMGKTSANSGTAFAEMCLSLQKLNQVFIIQELTTMKTKILFTFIALFLAISVSAQPPRAREEARRLTNHMDRKVGLSRGQYDEIYRINLRYALREIGPERRDRAYQRVLTPRQWDDYMITRPRHPRGPRPEAGPPPPRRDRGPHHRRGSRARRR